MKQRQSYHRLLYHVVIHTKDRAPLIESAAEGEIMRGFFVAKAPDLDSYVEEFGCWREHTHLLLRCATTRALSEVYGQLKGFAATAWRKRFPDRPFKWGDGVYIESVDPDDCEELRHYIRNQWKRHEEASTVEAWEHVEPTPP